MTTRELRRLVKATKYAIYNLSVVNSTHIWPVNWRDLRCVEASWVRTDLGKRYAKVLIEGASPDAAEFRQAVAKELEGQEWFGIVVETSWETHGKQITS